jgi:hypothetical protein
MADWTAPFHRPHMSSAEFDDLRRKYIEKYGYTVTIPGLEDIFHFGTEKPMTPMEEINWKAKNWGAFSKDRYEEIRWMKKRRKDLFLAMLGSPSPEIVRSRAAIITSFDDAQDALSTLGAIGSLLYMAGTAAARKAIRGPLGWILGAGDALNFVNKAMAPEQRMLTNKKLTEKITRHNNKSSRSGLRLRDKIKALKETDWEMKRLERIQSEVDRLRKGGWKGKLIEGLQTSDNVYGRGISLGALMNLPYDAAIGAARAQSGERVTVKMPSLDPKHWGRVARRLARNWLAFESAPEHYFIEEHHSPAVQVEKHEALADVIGDDTYTQMKIALFLAQQTIHMTTDYIDPLDMDYSISDLQLQAPKPTNILTLEAIEEAGDRPEDGCTWPATGEQWSNAQELIEESSQHIQDNLNAYAERHRHSVKGWAAANHAVNAGFYALENLAGTGTVQIEHNPSYRVVNGLQWLNFCVDEELSSGQKQAFAGYLQRCDDQNYTPHTKEVVDFAQRHCGFTFVQMHA